MKKSLIAGAVHTGLAWATAASCEILCGRAGLTEVALSGGVWQNRRLTAFTRKFLLEKGLTPLVHKLLPPNDECVSAGQVMVAGEVFKKS